MIGRLHGLGDSSLWLRMAWEETDAPIKKVPLSEHLFATQLYSNFIRRPIHHPQALLSRTFLRDSAWTGM